MKKVFLSALGICALSVMLSSCYVQNVSVGMTNDEPANQVAKVKNHYFIGGLLVPKHDEAKNHVSDPQHFRLQTKATFWDGFFRGITSGIYTPTTTYYYEPVK